MEKRLNVVVINAKNLRNLQLITCRIIGIILTSKILLKEILVLKYAYTAYQKIENDY